jgi:phosphonate transport system ATP-binding protein
MVFQALKMVFQALKKRERTHKGGLAGSGVTCWNTGPGGTMLRLEGLTKTFGTLTAVDKVSFEVPAGQMLGIIGRSGAGKSTLLRMINRLTDPTAGSIICGGRNVTVLKGRELHLWRRECAMIFQQFNLVPRLDVLTNVLMGRLSYQPTPRSLLKLFTPEERALAVVTLERVEMTPSILQRADQLSGGQQQRVAIARALVQEPRILLADEPIASLDPRSAARVMDILRSINRDDGITVICNLHTIDTARTYCDRIIGMRTGQIIFDDHPKALDHDRIKEVYAATGSDDEVDENITSTTLPGVAPIELH